MPLTGEAKKLYQREYMRWRRSNDAPRECEACHKGQFVQAHHEDYNKPTEVLWLCAACHRKVHLIKSGKQRTKFNPYKNPLNKIKQREVQPEPLGDVTPFKAPFRPVPKPSPKSKRTRRG